MAAWYVEKHVSTSPEFSLIINKVGLDQGCLWLPEEAREQIESSVLSLKSLNLLSANVLRDIEDRLSGTPWVKEVTRVEKVFPGNIEFSLMLRRPVAWVSHRSGTYLVDMDAFTLPIKDKNAPEIVQLPLIVGLPARVNIPPPGGRWNSRRLREGIYVAAYLQATKKDLSEQLTKIQHIDVREAKEKGVGVVLVTNENENLYWGELSQQGKIPLISDEEKLANLRLILQGRENILKDREYYLLWTTPLTAGPKRKAADNQK